MTFQDFCGIIASMIAVFNKYHMILLGSTLAIFLILIIFFLWLRTKSSKATKIGIAILLFANLLLHCLRIVFPPPWANFYPFAYQYITPISISAVNAITFPFIFLMKSRTLKDYMFYFGIITGGLALLVPGNSLGRHYLAFDSIRFFITHGAICIAPILMVMCGHHRIDWRRAWRAPVIMPVVLAIILVNEIILTAMGIVGQTMDLLLSDTYRNGAMVFGPEPNGGIASDVMAALTPEIFKTALHDIPRTNISKGDTLFWPIIWILVPGAIIFIPTCVIIGIICDPKRFWWDMKVVWYTCTRQKEKRMRMRPRKLTRLKRH